MTAAVSPVSSPAPAAAPAFLPPAEARKPLHITAIAKEAGLKVAGVAAVALLIAEGGTVPFIARYRKEATGDLDEVAITTIRDRLVQMEELDLRRDTVLRSIHEQGKLTDELKNKVLGAATMSVLEDIYLPFKPKRRTRGMIAKEKGLEPLANFLLAQMREAKCADVMAEAAKYIKTDAEKDLAVPDVAAALAGARDVIAEAASENAEVRARLRKLYESEAQITSKVLMGKEAEGAKFRDYFEWSEPAKAAPSHRVLAIRRGATEGFLSFTVQPPEESAQAALESHYAPSGNPAGEQVRLALKDCFKRLLSLSMETEMRLSMKKRAEEEAIKVFADNLRPLLLASPLGQKRTLGIDPGFRTGCKIAILDAQGKFLGDDKIYLHEEMNAARQLRALVEKHKIEAIAVGNGTAGRETQDLCEKALERKVPVIMVSESGASVYSASEVAREEFPDLDLTIRGAIAIGRRLMDPLAELVKTDPKSIGVGQYQHDVDQRQLALALTDTVVSCVSSVGVELNTASKQLLANVAGLTDRVAGAVVEYRNAHGAFKSRFDLLKVPGFGPKTFLQAGGFLRVGGAENPLDASAVHPERYNLVETMAKDAGVSVKELIASAEKRAKIDLSKYVCDTVGLPTLKDILSELAKPGRDPREPFQLFAFDASVKEIGDLKVGMKLPGIITNVAAFGAFVDIGVHQDGLIHISQLADKFIERADEVVKVQQKVEVTVMEVDIERKRIALSMKKNPDLAARKPMGQSASGPGQMPGGGKPPVRNFGGALAPKKTEPDTSNNPFKDFFKGRKI